MKVEQALAIARGLEGQNVALALRRSLKEERPWPKRTRCPESSSPAWAPSTDRATTSTTTGKACRGGRVAIREVEHISMEGYRTEIGGEVQSDMSPSTTTSTPAASTTAPSTSRCRAAEEAMERCGVGVGDGPAERWGVVVGTCNAGLLAGEEWYRKRKDGEEARSQAAAAGASRRRCPRPLSGAFGIKGPVLSVDTACAASANAIGYGAELIRLGQADAVLTGGVGRVLGHPDRGLQLARVALARARRALLDRPQGPLARRGQRNARADARRTSPRRRARTILAEIAGYGLSADGYHPTAPHPEGKGAARAIKTGLRQAGIAPERGGLREQPRHRHGQERHRRDGRHQGGPRRGGGLQRGGLEHQVDDRAPAGRRRARWRRS